MCPGYTQIQSKHTSTSVFPQGVQAPLGKEWTGAESSAEEGNVLPRAVGRPCGWTWGL